MDWIAKRANLTGNRQAIIDIEKQRTLTYTELNRSAERWAAFLLYHHIQKGDRVAVLGENQAELFEILFACGKIGAILVPINWRLSKSEIEYILQDCQPKVLLYNDSFEEIMKQLNFLKSYSFSIIEQFTSPIKTISTENIEEEDPWLIIYTGGTTGKPKGVVLSHRAVDWNALNTIVSWGLTEDEVTLNYMPLFHTGGINALSLPILMNGGKVVIGNKFDPQKALYYLHLYKCTIALFVPTMYHMMQQTEEFHKLDFSHMKVFLSGGAPCPLTIYEKFAEKGYQFKEGYGLTEAGPNNFFIDPKIAQIKRGSVGKPMMFNEVKLVDFDGKEITGTGVGELLIRGKHAFIEYWNNKQATEETWQDGWLHTGDLARRDDDGYYYIVGRKKDMIITGGENVYPIEVEQTLIEHPIIDEVAVVGIPDEKWGEKVTAFISLKNNQQIEETELIHFCKKKLANYKIPKSFIILEQLPKTDVGKIDKKALKSLKTSV